MLAKPQHHDRTGRRVVNRAAHVLMNWEKSETQRVTSPAVLAVPSKTAMTVSMLHAYLCVVIEGHVSFEVRSCVFRHRYAI